MEVKWKWYESEIKMKLNDVKWSDTKCSDKKLNDMKCKRNENETK